MRRSGQLSRNPEIVVNNPAVARDLMAQAKNGDRLASEALANAHARATYRANRASLDRDFRRKRTLEARTFSDGKVHEAFRTVPWGKPCYAAACGAFASDGGADPVEGEDLCEACQTAEKPPAKASDSTLNIKNKDGTDRSP